jgi:hypothetical protein
VQQGLVERELHLSTLEHEEVYIDGTQVEKVHRLIQLILELTAKIRDAAPDNIKNKLIIFEYVEESRRMGRKIIVDYDPKGKAGKWYIRFRGSPGLLLFLEMRLISMSQSAVPLWSPIWFWKVQASRESRQC